MRRLLVLGLVVACGPSGRLDAPVLTIPPPSSAAPVVTVTRPEAPSPEPTPRSPELPTCASPPRDPRVRPVPRASALVATEHAALKRLYDGTRDRAPDKPLVALRLGDVETELARAEPSQESLSGDAAAHYEVARREGKGAPYEAATYRLALDAECRGDMATARKLAFEIVSRAPTSVWVPHAYLLFGELFLVEGAKEPAKLELARMSYLEARKRRGDASITELANERLRSLPSKPEPDDP